MFHKIFSYTDYNRLWLLIEYKYIKNIIIKFIELLQKIIKILFEDIK